MKSRAIRKKKLKVKNHSRRRKTIRRKGGETQQKPKYYFVEGLGCSELNNDGKFNFLEVINKDNYVCHAKMSAPIRGIINSITKNTPMQNSTFLNNLVDQVLTDADTRDVYVYGHSYGGAIVNRLAEELAKKPEEFAKKLNRIFVAAFGSIYLAKLPEKSNVNLINYIAIGDVSNTTTRDAPRVKSVNDVKDLIDYKDVTFGDDFIMCKYKKRDDSNIFDVCLYTDKMETYEDAITKEKKTRLAGTTPTCDNRILNIPGVRAVHEWAIHNGYLRLIKHLMMNKTNNVDIPNIAETFNDKSPDIIRISEVPNVSRIDDENENQNNPSTA